MGMENAQVMVFTDGEVGVTLGALYRYFHVFSDITIVAVAASPSADDADATIDINDDGTVAIAAVTCDDKEIPGTWKSTHIGGTNDPVTISRDSVVSLDANSAASGTRIMVQIWYLPGSVGS